MSCNKKSPVKSHKKYSSQINNCNWADNFGCELCVSRKAGHHMTVPDFTTFFAMASKQMP